MRSIVHADVDRRGRGRGRGRTRGRGNGGRAGRARGKWRCSASGSPLILPLSSLRRSSSLLPFSRLELDEERNSHLAPTSGLVDDDDLDSRRPGAAQGAEGEGALDLALALAVAVAGRAQQLIRPHTISSSLDPSSLRAVSLVVSSRRPRVSAWTPAADTSPSPSDSVVKCRRSSPGGSCACGRG